MYTDLLYTFSILNIKNQQAVTNLYRRIDWKGMLAQTWNTSIWEAKVGGCGGPDGLHTEIQANPAVYWEPAKTERQSLTGSHPGMQKRGKEEIKKAEVN